MKCPYCGKEMTLGYIQNRDGVYWTEKKLPVPALPLGGGETLAVGREQSCGYTNQRVEAWNCWTCKRFSLITMAKARQKQNRNEEKEV